MNNEFQFRYFWKPEKSLLDIDTIIDITKNVKCYKKGDIVVPEGAICRNFFLINNGLLKQCQLLHNKESILNFFPEGYFCTVLDSFQNRVPSSNYIVAMENTELYSITYDELILLRSKNEKFNQLLNDLFIYGSGVIVSRLKSMYEKDKEKAYQDFLKDNRNLIQRVNLGDIANFLGITLVHLSRIRLKYKTK